MASKRLTPPSGSEAGSDRVVINIKADSTDEELLEMAHGISEWIKEQGGSFLSEAEDERTGKSVQD